MSSTLAEQVYTPWFHTPRLRTLDDGVGAAVAAPCSLRQIESLCGEPHRRGLDLASCLDKDSFAYPRCDHSDGLVDM